MSEVLGTSGNAQWPVPVDSGRAATAAGSLWLFRTGDQFRGTFLLESLVSPFVRCCNSRRQAGKAIRIKQY
eukprot:3936804-Pleurochrysis_carterae.AAC.1